MAQFRVEFVQDQASGKYLAELYSPENQQELMVRTAGVDAAQAEAPPHRPQARGKIA